MEMNGDANRCPVCGQRESRRALEVHTDSHYDILTCNECGLAYAAPRPTPAELAHFYTSTYFTRDRETNLGYGNYRDAGEVNARKSWHELNRLVNLEQLTPRRILDVGCATGGFISEAGKYGWECVGVELSEHAAEVARKEHHVNAINGDIFYPDLDCGSFGLVTMYHVLEHMIDPLAALTRARDLLAPGGLLFVELPNWNSIARYIRKSSWAQLKPPEHINFFTPRSLAAAVQRTGLSIQFASSHYEPTPPGRGIRLPATVAINLAKRVAAGAGNGGYARVLAKKGQQ